MTDLTDRILDFLASLEQTEEVYPYLYNMKKSRFDAGADPVYYSGPYWTRDEVAAAIETLIAGQWLASGESVSEFERAFSKRFGFRESVMVNSGSSANLAMIAALKKFFRWDDDDEVILSAVGFPTTLAPLMQNGLRPVLTDIEFDTLNFDLDDVARKLTDRTRAVFVSPVLGNPPDFDRLLELVGDANARYGGDPDPASRQPGIKIIVDNCDSLGSRWDGRYLTDYAVAASCSFYPAHHITTGEGGMISSRHTEIAVTARSFAWWGRDCYCVGANNLLSEGTCKKRFSPWLKNHGYDGIIDHKYVFSNVGYNLKPLDLQGAIGLTQLDKFDEIHALRRRNKETLADIFTTCIPDVRVPDELPKAETSWFGVPLVCASAKLKTRLVAHLEQNRIQTRNYFAGNILQHPAYSHLDDVRRYPHANEVLDRVFFVGCSPTCRPEMIEHIGNVVHRFASEA
jgi:CDP-6-deoxy-D-xylo-4-hexulose-3-dehydrase